MTPPNTQTESTVDTLTGSPDLIPRIEAIHRTSAAVDRSTPATSRYHGKGRILKRSFDLILSLIALPLLLPVFAVICLGIVVSSPGSPFFRQRRVGRDGREFGMIKFRTMCVDAERQLHENPAMYARFVANDFKLPVGDDPRVFSFGRLLRHTSLDELPQLLNVVLGQMSLVGPRPVEPAQVPISYGPRAGVYFAMRPGLTGLWQVSGRGHVKFPERAALDEHYLENWTFWSDIVILLQTVPSVIRRIGSR